MVLNDVCHTTTSLHALGRQAVSTDHRGKEMSKTQEANHKTDIIYPFDVLIPTQYSRNNKTIWCFLGIVNRHLRYRFNNPRTTGIIGTVKMYKWNYQWRTFSFIHIQYEQKMLFSCTFRDSKVAHLAKYTCCWKDWNSSSVPLILHPWVKKEVLCTHTHPLKLTVGDVILEGT